MTQPKPGDRVIYVPTHAEGDPSHPDCERGQVSSFNGETAFVKFDQYVERLGWEGATAQACSPRDLILAIPEGDQRERAIQCVVDWIASNSTLQKGKRSKKYVITFEMAMKVVRLVGGQKKWSRSVLVSTIECYHRGRGEHFIAYFQGHPAFEYIEHGNGRVSVTIDESVAGLAEKCDRLEERLRELQAGENS